MGINTLTAPSGGPSANVLHLLASQRSQKGLIFTRDAAAPPQKPPVLLVLLSVFCVCVFSHS